MSSVVFDRLQPAPTNGRGTRPPNVARWVNLADMGDIIATPPDLSQYFDGIDHHDGDLHISRWGFHAVRHYLTCPQTTQTLLAAPLAGVTGSAKTLKSPYVTNL